MSRKPIIISLLAVVIIIACIFSCGSSKIEVSAESVPSTQKSQKATLNVFIENSGSMDGYMCDGSQLKDAVYDYVSELNRLTDATKLYYINSREIPYDGTLQSYIKTMTPATFHSAGGNTANTDMGDLITRVLDTVNDTTVSIFISDCILDLPSKNATDYLVNCEITIKEAVINAQKRVPDLGVIVIKLTSKFNGKYFAADGKVVTLKDVQRPYYIWIFGDKNYLAEFNQKVPVAYLEKYNLQDYVSFTNKSEVPFVISNNTLTGQIINPANGYYGATIRADFSSTLLPDGYISGANNYQFVNQGLAVAGVYPIDRKATNETYTHYIQIEIPAQTPVAQERLTLLAPQTLPQWVNASNDDNGTDVENNLDKTTGIKYLIQGVADAFKTETVSTSFTFNVKRK